MNTKAKNITAKPKQYRVYLAWGKSSDDLLDGMECLLQRTRIKEDGFDLVDNEEVLMTAVSRTVEFVLVDDPDFTEHDIPTESQEVYLRVVRRKLFGRILVHAEPVGPPPKGCVLSGRTGRIVWGGGDVVKDISPRPIPIRYWIRDSTGRKRPKKRKA
jgi:hypothetical protein